MRLSLRRCHLLPQRRLARAARRQIVCKSRNKYTCRVSARMRERDAGPHLSTCRSCHVQNVGTVCCMHESLALL